jgi:plastocyanin
MIGRTLMAAAAIITLSASAPARHHAAPSRTVQKPPAKPATAPVTVSVQIKMFAFTPKVLTIAVGTTVTWTNVDDEPHTVTSVGGAFHSSALDTNDKYSFTFSKPGDYPYYCRLHPQMTAKVIVRPR